VELLGRVNIDYDVLVVWIVGGTLMPNRANCDKVGSFRDYVELERCEGDVKVNICFSFKKVKVLTD
jgi:hypothetical protein